RVVMAAREPASVSDAPAPSLASELRRGLNPYSLFVSATSSTALGLGMAAFARYLQLSQQPFLAVVLVVASGLFVAIAGIHAAMHAYFGWRLGSGVEQFRAGHIARAISQLRVLDRPGVDHYDPTGSAQAALQSARSVRSEG